MSASDSTEGILYQNASLVDDVEVLRGFDERKERLDVVGHLIDELGHHFSLYDAQRSSGQLQILLIRQTERSKPMRLT